MSSSPERNKPSFAASSMHNDSRNWGAASDHDWHQTQVRDAVYAAEVPLEAEIADLKKQLAESLAATAALQAALDAREHELAELRKQLDSTPSHEAQVGALQARITALEEELRVKSLTLARFTEDLKKRMQELRELQATLTSERSDWTVQRARYEADLAELRKAMTAAEKSHAATVSQMQAAHEQALAEAEEKRRVEVLNLEQAAKVAADIAKAKIAKLEASNAALEQQVVDKDQQMAEMAAAHAAAAAELRALLEDVQGQLAAEQRARAQAEAELAEAVSTHAEQMAAKNAEMEAQTVAHQEQVAEWGKRLEQEQQAHAQTKQLCSSLEARILEQQEQHAAELAAREEQHKAALRTLSEELASVRAALAAAEEQVEAGKAQLLEMTNLVQELREQLELSEAELERRTAEHAAERDRLEGALQEAEKAAKAAREAIKRAEAVMRSLCDILGSLTEASAAMKSEVDRCREQAEITRNGYAIAARGSKMSYQEESQLGDAHAVLMQLYGKLQDMFASRLPTEGGSSAAEGFQLASGLLEVFAVAVDL